MTIEFECHFPAIGKKETLAVPAGSTLADMAATFPGRVDRIEMRGVAGWDEVAQGDWHRIRPKVSGVVALHARPGFGIGEAITFLILSAQAGAFATGLAAVASAFAPALLGIGLSAASFLLQNMFAGERQRPRDDEGRRSAVENVDSDANMLGRYSYLPVVFGEGRRIAPPDIVKPHLFLESGVETIERLLAVHGHHDISDIWVDGTPVSDMATITAQTRDGGPGTTTNTFVDRFTEPAPVGGELTGFRVEERELEDQSFPDNSHPIPLRFKTRGIPGLSEVAIRLRLDGLVRTDQPTNNVRLPFRARFRPQGGDDGDWINLPEIHVLGVESGSRFIEIRVRKDSQFGAEDSSGAVRFAFFREVPPATATLFDHSGTQWEADAAFSFGSGLRDVKDVVGRRHGVRVTVPEEMFFDQGTEWEIIRGSASDESALNNSYQIGGNVVSFFRARNEGTSQTPEWFVPQQQARYPARLSIAHATAIAETHPCQKPGTALIALRSRGQNIRNVTAVIGRYVMDWDGSGWNTPVITSNPALHARQLLADLIQYARVAEHSRIPRFRDMGESLIDDADFVAWRDQCDAMGAQVSYLSQGEPVAMVLQSILAAGLARPSFGSRLSIDWFRDRSSEQPVITFSPRNSNLKVVYENPIRPMGVTAKFRNRHKDWQEDELEVRALITGNTGNWIREEIRGIDDPDWLRQRLTFDMLRAEHWRTIYEIETPLEGMALARGSLIGVVTDLVDDKAHGARVRAVPDPQILDIDQIIPSQEVLPDMSEIGEGFDFDDLFDVGEQSVVLVTTPHGMEMRVIIGSEQVSRQRGRITLDSPLSSTDVKGAHVSIGSLSNRVRRCVVVEESPRDEFSKTVVAADEAPKIFNTMKQKFGWADV